MSRFRKKNTDSNPPVSTASLPDIVFMLLFFFMVATDIRQENLLIQNQLPYADQVEKLDKKELVMFIYAGKPSERYQSTYGTEARIQLNDKFATIADIKPFVFAERDQRREEEIPYLTTALKVDSDTNVGLVSDIKQELRDINALKVNYTTRKGSALQNIR